MGIDGHIECKLAANKARLFSLNLLLGL